MSKVFISHAEEDAEVAAEIARHLESIGIDCWVAFEDITPGTRWSEAIVGAIAASRLMILVLSRHANQSGHVAREAELADNEKVPIIPLRIEAVEPANALKYYLSTAHRLNAEALSRAQMLERLTNTIRRLAPDLFAPDPASDRFPPVSKAGEDRVVHANPPQQSRRTPGHQRTALANWFTALVGLALMFLMFVLLFSPRREDRDGTAPTTNADSQGASPGPGPGTQSQAPADSAPPVGGRVRPLRSGSSIGVVEGVEGTLGAFVVDENGQKYAMTDLFTAVAGGGRAGMAVLQPGLADGGQYPRDVVGTVPDSSPLQSPVRAEELIALIPLDEDQEIDPAVPGAGRLTGAAPVNEALVGAKVRMYGRTSGLARGEISEVAKTVDLMLARGRPLQVTGAIFAGPMARQGDAGSLVIDANNRAVGIVIGAGPHGTIIAPLQPLLRTRRVRLITQ